MSFFKESIKEFDHVVWPTSAETKKYFNIVVSMIIILTIFLFIVGTAFSVGLLNLKKQIQPIRPTTSSTPATPGVQDLKLDNINLNTTTIPAPAPVATPIIPPTPTPAQQ